MPLKQKPRGPGRRTPFRHNQRVIVANDQVILNATIVEPQFNLNYNEILRNVDWGCKVLVPPQEGFEGFLNDVRNCTRHVEVCHTHGVWRGSVHATLASKDGIELLLKEATWAGPQDTSTG